MRRPMATGPILTGGGLGGASTWRMGLVLICAALGATALAGPWVVGAGALAVGLAAAAAIAGFATAAGVGTAAVFSATLAAAGVGEAAAA